MPEIDDPVVRGAIDLFASEMEYMIFTLLSQDGDIALAQVNVARQRVFETLKKAELDGVAEDSNHKALRIARDLVVKSLDRLTGMAKALNDKQDGLVADPE